MSESNPGPVGRTEEQHAAVRRRALPVAVGGVLCAVGGLVVAWLHPPAPFSPPSFYAMSLPYCAMLIGVGIFLYAKPTPRTGGALLLSLLAVLLGIAGSIVYTVQSVSLSSQMEKRELGNVTAIADAARAYAKEHGGAYPADLLVLLEEKRIRPGTLQSPWGAASPLFNDIDSLLSKQVPREEKLATVEKESDYIYLGSDLHEPPADLAGKILVAVSNGTVMRVSMAVAYADGAAAFIDKDDVPATMTACNAARAKMGLNELKPPAVIEKVMEETPNKKN